MLKKLFSSSILELIGMLTPIIILPVLLKSLTKSELADYLLITMLLLISQQIIDYAYTYITSKWTLVELQDNFSTVFSAKIILFGISTILIVLLCAFSLDSFNFLILLSVLIGLISLLLSPHWIFIPIGEYHKFQLINTIPKAFLVIYSFIIPSVYSFEVFIFLSFLTGLIVNVYVFLSKTKSININVRELRFKAGIRSIKKDYHLFVADFIPQIYVTLPLIIFKGSWTNADYIALSIAQRFYNAGMTMLWTSLKVAIPQYKTTSENNIANVLYVLAAVSASGFFAVILFSDSIIKMLFNEVATETTMFLKILSFGFFGACLYITYGYAFAIYNKAEGWFKNNSFYISIPSFFIVFISSSVYSAFGYAIAISLVRVFIGIYFLFHYKFLRLKF